MCIVPNRTKGVVRVVVQEAPPGGEPPPHVGRRRWLAAELRRLRERAGVSGRELARRIDVSQSKVSRIESGALTPPVPAVLAWADAVGADPATRDRLAALTEAVFAETQAWRLALPGRGHLQDDVERREAQARRIRVFQPTAVPGLLQTAEYARRVFGLFHLPYAEADLARAVAARLERQSALYDPRRRFAFLVTEAALRWRPGPPALLRAQLDRIGSLMTLGNVTIGLIPSDATAVIAVPSGFDLLDGAAETGGADASTVTVETLHANLVITDPAHVAEYEQAWTALQRMAVHGDGAERLLRRLRRGLPAGDE